MKITGMAVAIILLFVLTGESPAGVPALEPGVLIYDGANPLDVDGFSVVEVVDWNNDNMKDLVIGQFINGNIRLFLNVGTDPDPAFNGGSLIESNGVPITTSFG